MAKLLDLATTIAAERRDTITIDGESYPVITRAEIDPVQALRWAIQAKKFRDLGGIDAENLDDEALGNLEKMLAQMADIVPQLVTAPPEVLARLSHMNRILIIEKVAAAVFPKPEELPAPPAKNSKQKQSKS